MRIIKITEEKKEKLSDYVEKMLKYGGKAMQCIDELDEGGMGERYDDDDDDDDMDDDMGYRNGGGMGQRKYRRESGGMGERRSRRTGRFIR